MTDFKTWLRDYGHDKIFRMLIRRRVGDWTPYEVENKFVDQSQYESDFLIKVKIVDAVELPDKDILIGYVQICSLYDLAIIDELPVAYKRLSEIELNFFPSDMDFRSYED